MDQPAYHMDQTQIRDRYGRADLVVSGRVVAIQLPPDVEEPLSEHAPVWKDATCGHFARRLGSEQLPNGLSDHR